MRPAAADGRWASLPGVGAPADTGQHGGHGLGAFGPGLTLTGPLTTTLAIVALVLGAAVAGTALLAAGIPQSPRLATALRTTTAMLAATAAIGWLGQGMAGTALLAPVAAAGAAAVLTNRGHRRAAAAAGGGLLLLLARDAAGAGGAWWAALNVAFVVSAALWLGWTVCSTAVDAGTTSDPGAASDPGARTRQRPLALAAAAVLVAVPLVRAGAEGLRIDAPSASSATGLTAVAAVALLVGAGLLGALPLPRRVGGPGGGGVRLSAASVVLVLGVAAATTSAMVTPPPRAAATGEPLIRAVTPGDDPLTVVVAPQRPGRNLVHVTTPGVLVGGVPALPREGATGGWALVELPAGTRELDIDDRGRHARLRLALGDTPATGPLADGLAGEDGPECLSALVGAVLAGHGLPERCPSATLSTEDATALRATVRFLGTRVPALQVIGDSSARSAAALELIRRIADRDGPRLVEGPTEDAAVLVVAGWARAERRLVGTGLGLSTRYGAYTAGWLAVQAVIGRQTGAVTTLDFDPRGEPATRYLATLRAAGLSDLVSPAGLRAFLGAGGGPGNPDGAGPRVFSSAQISIFPAELDEGHHHGADGWLPGGTLTAVTRPLLSHPFE